VWHTSTPEHPSESSKLNSRHGKYFHNSRPLGVLSRQRSIAWVFARVYLDKTCQSDDENGDHDESKDHRRTEEVSDGAIIIPDK